MSEELIRNCKFRFKCNQEWSKMTETEDPEIRHCDHCNESVHLCRTAQDLKQAIVDNWCVAIYKTETISEYPELIGEVAPGYFTKP